MVYNRRPALNVVFGDERYGGSFAVGVAPISLEILGNCNHEINSVTLKGATEINNRDWRHVAIIRNGEVVSLFIDGELDSSESQPNVANFGNLGELLIGSEGFSGLLDEVRIWNQALSLEQIQQNRFDSFPGTIPGLVGYWRFDEGEGEMEVKL